MIVNDIAKARDCGRVRFHAVFGGANEIQTILSLFHLKGDADLRETTREGAVETIVRWLHRDLAYNTEIMSIESAEELSERFISEFADDSSHFYSNGSWRLLNPPEQWDPMTDATFDGGVIIVSGEPSDVRAACLWFEDED